MSFLHSSVEIANSTLVQCIGSILWIFAKCIRVNANWNVKYLDYCFFWEGLCRIRLIEFVCGQRYLNNPYPQNPPVNFRCVEQQHKLIIIESWKYASVILLTTLITLANGKGIIPYGWKSVNSFVSVYFEGIFVLFLVIQLLEWKSVAYEVIVQSMLWTVQRMCQFSRNIFQTVWMWEMS